MLLESKIIPNITKKDLIFDQNNKKNDRGCAKYNVAASDSFPDLSWINF